MSYFPSSEQVAVAYLKTVAALDPTKIATSLPADAAVWAASGFVQVQVVGGTPEVHVPKFSPVIEVTCWANNSNSQQPPWGKASHLAEAVKFSTYSQRSVLLETPENFYDVRLLSVYPVSEPRRVLGDEAGFARVSVDLAFHWTLAGVTV
jgi:hypothetical protein